MTGSTKKHIEHFEVFEFNPSDFGGCDPNDFGGGCGQGKQVSSWNAQTAAQDYGNARDVVDLQQHLTESLRVWVRDREQVVSVFDVTAFVDVVVRASQVDEDAKESE
jgi:hypothetical protein